MAPLMEHSPEPQEGVESEQPQPQAAQSGVSLQEWLAALFVPVNGCASDAQTRLFGALAQVRFCATRHCAHTTVVDSLCLSRWRNISRSSSVALKAMVL